MYQTHGIIGPFQTHLPICQLDKTPVGVRLTFAADNSEGMTIVLNRHTQAVMERVIARVEKELGTVSLKDAAGAIFKRAEAAIPEMRDQFNRHAFKLVNAGIKTEGKQEVNSHGRVPELICQISEHQATFWHSHSPKVGPDSTYHSHDVTVQFFLASKSIHVASEMSERLQWAVEKLFDKRNKSFSKTLEKAGEQLLNLARASVGDVGHPDPIGKRLRGVSLAIQYDGSLDHPTQRMEFIRSL